MHGHKYLLFLCSCLIKCTHIIHLSLAQGRIACAPFFYVTFADFWIADQLTSLSLAMLDTEYFFCYLFYGKDDPGQLLALLGPVG